MSRNFHNVHVHAPTQRKRDAVVKAVLAYAKKAGLERVKSAATADRVIRIGGKAPWFSVEDDGYEAQPVAAWIAKTTKLPVLEAYCEASARVSLSLYANGRRAGGWAEPGKRAPAAKLVAPLLATGTPKDLAAKWDEGIRQVFPETALGLAAEQLGIRVEQLFGEAQLRGGVTIALRRKKAKWTAKYQKGAPAFYVGWGSNQGFGVRHLVFADDIATHRVQIGSKGGAGRGFVFELGGSAIDDGFVEIVECAQEKMKLVRDGNTWRDDGVVIPAGLVEEPDVLALSRREADRAREVQWATEWYVEIKYRALKEGACQFVGKTSSGDGSTASGSLGLQVMWKPWRPSVTLPHIENVRLFAMHRKEHVIANIALRGTLAEAWTWARPHIERWAAAHGDHGLSIMRDGDVTLSEQGETPPYDRIAAEFGDARTPFRAAGASFLFGTTAHAPYRMDPREHLVVHLILARYDPTSDNGPLLTELEAVCDDAMARGVAYSAVVYEDQYRPDTTTPFETLAVSDTDPLHLAAWHETHVCSVDKRIWLSAKHASRLDRDKLPTYVTLTPVGDGVRLQVAEGHARSELEPLIGVLGALVPTQAEVERWTAARAALPLS